MSYPESPVVQPQPSITEIVQERLEQNGAGICLARAEMEKFIDKAIEGSPADRHIVLTGLKDALFNLERHRRNQPLTLSAELCEKLLSYAESAEMEHTPPLASVTVLPVEFQYTSDQQPIEMEIFPLPPVPAADADGLRLLTGQP